MAKVIGRIVPNIQPKQIFRSMGFDKISIIEIDDDPSISGLDASVGTIAILDDNGTGRYFYRLNDTSNTSWVEDTPGTVTIPDPIKLTDGMVWIVNSTLPTTEFGNGISYTELRHSQSDWIDLQLFANSSDDVDVEILYSMSSSESADVKLRVDSVSISEGSNPTSSATLGTPTIITVTNDVLAHKATIKTFSMTGGSLYYLKINRLGSDLEDTHTGEMRIIEVRVK